MAFLKIGANEKIQIVKVGENTEIRITSKGDITIETEGKKEEELEVVEDKKTIETK